MLETENYRGIVDANKRLLSSCDRNTQPLFVALLSIFYEQYGIVQEVLGHFSDSKRACFFATF